MNKLTNTLLILCLLGIIYLIYHQNISYPNKLKRCNDIAVGFERARHYPIDDMQVTNQDISGYMKNVVNCLID